MSEEEKIGQTMAYFRRYRDMVQRIAKAEAEHEEKSRQWEMERESFLRRRNELGLELQTMRRIITKMIEEDMDPTLAKLQQDESWYGMQTMWDKSDPFEYDSVVDLSSISITGAIGSIGATSTIAGAVGASSSSWSMGPSYGPGSPGANGPGGPFTTT